jgi:hypothetical protein
MEANNEQSPCIPCLHKGRFDGPPTLAMSAANAGWGTTDEAPSTCTMAPEGSYSPGGPMASTRVQLCVDGTTNVGAGHTHAASCDICLPGMLGGGHRSF